MFDDWFKWLGEPATNGWLALIVFSGVVLQRMTARGTHETNQLLREIRDLLAKRD